MHIWRHGVVVVSVSDFRSDSRVQWLEATVGWSPHHWVDMLDKKLLHIVSLHPAGFDIWSAALLATGLVISEIY